jgi:hypothetical protein
MTNTTIMIGLVSLMGLTARVNSQVPSGTNDGNFQVHTASCPKCGEAVATTEVRVNGGRTDNAGGHYEQRSAWFHSKCGYEFTGELPEIHYPKVIVATVTVNRSELMASANNTVPQYIRTALPNDEPPLPPMPMDAVQAEILKQLKRLSDRLTALEQKVK